MGIGNGMYIGEPLVSSLVTVQGARQRMNKWASARHYRKHKDAYHAQALQDAAAEGYDINFKGDVAKKVKELNSNKPRERFF